MSSMSWQNDRSISEVESNFSDHYVVPSASLFNAAGSIPIDYGKLLRDAGLLDPANAGPEAWDVQGPDIKNIEEITQPLQINHKDSDEDPNNRQDERSRQPTASDAVIPDHDVKPVNGDQQQPVPHTVIQENEHISTEALDVEADADELTIDLLLPNDLLVLVAHNHGHDLDEVEINLGLGSDDYHEIRLESVIDSHSPLQIAPMWDNESIPLSDLNETATCELSCDTSIEREARKCANTILALRDESGNSTASDSVITASQLDRLAAMTLLPVDADMGTADDFVGEEGVDTMDFFFDHNTDSLVRLEDFSFNEVGHFFLKPDEPPDPDGELQLAVDDHPTPRNEKKGEEQAFSLRRPDDLSIIDELTECSSTCPGEVRLSSVASPATSSARLNPVEDDICSLRDQNSFRALSDFGAKQLNSPLREFEPRQKPKNRIPVPIKKPENEIFDEYRKPVIGSGGQPENLPSKPASQSGPGSKISKKIGHRIDSLPSRSNPSTPREDDIEPEGTNQSITDVSADSLMTASASGVAGKGLYVQKKPKRMNKRYVRSSPPRESRPVSNPAKRTASPSPSSSTSHHGSITETEVGPIFDRAPIQTKTGLTLTRPGGQTDKRRSPSVPGQLAKEKSASLSQLDGVETAPTAATAGAAPVVRMRNGVPGQRAITPDNRRLRAKSASSMSLNALAGSPSVVHHPTPDYSRVESRVKQYIESVKKNELDNKAARSHANQQVGTDFKSRLMAKSKSWSNLSPSRSSSLSSLAVEAQSSSRSRRRSAHHLMEARGGRVRPTTALSEPSTLRRAEGGRLKLNRPRQAGLTLSSCGSQQPLGVTDSSTERTTTPVSRPNLDIGDSRQTSVEADSDLSAANMTSGMLVNSNMSAAQSTQRRGLSPKSHYQRRLKSKSNPNLSKVAGNQDGGENDISNFGANFAESAQWSKSAVSVTYGDLERIIDSDDSDYEAKSRYFSRNNLNQIFINSEDLLTLVFEERKGKHEMKKVIQELQTNYDQLLQRFAAAENALDNMRFCRPSTGIDGTADTNRREETIRLAESFTERLSRYQTDQNANYNEDDLSLEDELLRLGDHMARQAAEKAREVNQKSSIGAEISSDMQSNILDIQKQSLAIINKAIGIEMAVTSGVLSTSEAELGLNDLTNSLDYILNLKLPADSKEECIEETRTLLLDASRKLADIREKLRLESGLEPSGDLVWPQVGHHQQPNWPADPTDLPVGQEAANGGYNPSDKPVDCQSNELGPTVCRVDPQVPDLVKNYVEKCSVDVKAVNDVPGPGVAASPQLSAIEKVEQWRRTLPSACYASLPATPPSLQQGVLTRGESLSCDKIDWMEDRLPPSREMNAKMDMEDAEKAGNPTPITNRKQSVVSVSHSPLDLDSGCPGSDRSTTFLTATRGWSPNGGKSKVGSRENVAICSSSRLYNLTEEEKLTSRHSASSGQVSQRSCPGGRQSPTMQHVSRQVPFARQSPRDIVSINNKYVSRVTIERGIKLSPRALDEHYAVQENDQQLGPSTKDDQYENFLTGLTRPAAGSPVTQHHLEEAVPASDFNLTSTPKHRLAKAGNLDQKGQPAREFCEDLPPDPQFGRQMKRSRAAYNIQELIDGNAQSESITACEVGTSHDEGDADDRFDDLMPHEAHVDNHGMQHHKMKNRINHRFSSEEKKPNIYMTDLSSDEQALVLGLSDNEMDCIPDRIMDNPNKKHPLMKQYNEMLLRERQQKSGNSMPSRALPRGQASEDQMFNRSAVEDSGLAAQIDNEILELRNFFEDHREEMISLLQDPNSTMYGPVVNTGSWHKKMAANSFDQSGDFTSFRPKNVPPLALAAMDKRSIPFRPNSSQPFVHSSLPRHLYDLGSESDFPDKTLYLRQQEWRKRRMRRELKKQRRRQNSLGGGSHSASNAQIPTRYLGEAEDASPLSSFRSGGHGYGGRQTAIKQQYIYRSDPTLAGKSGCRGSTTNRSIASLFPINATKRVPNPGQDVVGCDDNYDSYPALPSPPPALFHRRHGGVAVDDGYDKLEDEDALHHHQPPDEELDGETQHDPRGGPPQIPALDLTDIWSDSTPHPTHGGGGGFATDLQSGPELTFSAGSKYRRTPRGSISDPTRPIIVYQPRPADDERGRGERPSSAKYYDAYGRWPPRSARQSASVEMISVGCNTEEKPRPVRGGWTSKATRDLRLASAHTQTDTEEAKPYENRLPPAGSSGYQDLTLAISPRLLLRPPTCRSPCCAGQASQSYREPDSLKDVNDQGLKRSASENIVTLSRDDQPRGNHWNLSQEILKVLEEVRDQRQFRGEHSPVIIINKTECSHVNKSREMSDQAGLEPPIEKAGSSSEPPKGKQIGDGATALNLSAAGLNAAIAKAAKASHHERRKKKGAKKRKQDLEDILKSLDAASDLAQRLKKRSEDMLEILSSEILRSGENTINQLPD